MSKIIIFFFISLFCITFINTPVLVAELIYPITQHLPDEIKKESASPKTKTTHTSHHKKQLFIELQFIEIAKRNLKKLAIPLPFSNDSTPFTFNIDSSLTLEPVKLQSTLQTLLQNGEATLLAAPQLLTLEGTESTIMIGDKIPYINTSYNGQYTTSTLNMIDSGVTLKIKTTSINNDTISIELNAIISSVKLFKEYASGSYPILSTREINSSMLLQNNTKSLIGAIHQKSERNNQNRSSLFVKIPILKNLNFLSQKEEEQTSILIFLKTEIVK